VIISGVNMSDPNNTYYDTYSGTCYLVQGNYIKPCPELLTESEAIQFLRLDVDGPTDPSQTLLYYRQKGLLKATRVGKKLRYQRKELLKFIDKLTELTNRKSA